MRNIEYIESFPNRNSFMLKKESNFYDWFVCSSVYFSHKVIKIEQIVNAVRVLLEENESLRIKFSVKNNKILEYIAELKDINKYIDIKYSEGENEDVIKNIFLERIAAYKKDLNEDSELFKLFIIVNENKKCYLYFMIHHIACDLVSYQIIKKRFFELIDNPKANNAISYVKYTNKIINHWKNNFDKNKEIYWNTFFNQRFDLLGSFESKYLLEKYTQKVEIKFDKKYNKIIKKMNKRDIIILILFSYSKSLYKWSEGKLENNIISLVHSGREYFDQEMNGFEVVGWLNQIFPISIRNNKINTEILDDIKTQLYYMYCSSSSYGVLKYKVKNPLFITIPDPQISINIILEEKNKYQKGFDTTEINIANSISRDSKRVFVLSSGFYIANNEYFFSIDFSNKIYSKENIDILIELFKNNFLNIMDQYDVC